MRTLLTLSLAVAGLAMSALVDPVFDLVGESPSAQLPMTVRIWLSALTMTLFFVLNYALAWFALSHGGRPRWAYAALMVIGGAITLYLPLWSLGLPGLSQLLSARSNPLTAIVARGGFLSYFKLESAGMLVLGLTGLLRSGRNQGSRSEPTGVNAA